MMKGSRTAMNNRGFIRIQLLLLFILLLACCIWSCSGKQDAPDGTASAGATSALPDTGSETKAEPETASETTPATETETETETATETVTEPETSFNEGKVDYAIVDGTVIATPQDGYSLGLDITDRTDLIGICYTMWFNAIHGDGEGKLEGCLNVEELIAQYGFSAKYGFGNEKEQHNHLHQFHYWSEPAQGYYRSTDTDAIRNNMRLLYKAGVDFLILKGTAFERRFQYRKEGL